MSYFVENLADIGVFLDKVYGKILSGIEKSLNITLK